MVPARSVTSRALLVLAVTLLVHALVLQHVDRLLAGAEPELPHDIAAVSARLLAPPVPPVATQAAPAPPAAPAPAIRKRPAAIGAPPVAAAPVEWPATVDVAPDAFGAEPVPTPQEPSVVAAAPTSPEPASTVEPAVGPAADSEPEVFDATGSALHAALAGLPQVRAALPVSARYVYRTTNSELRLASATSTVDWSLDGDGRYRLRLTTTAVGMTVLELDSQGTLRPFGLAPDRYTETRVRRGAATANFDWEGRRITFSARAHERPLADGVQDRISFQFQLMLLGQAQPERFRKGRQTVLWMASRDDVTEYRFRSTGSATAVTGIGELDAVRVERVVANDHDARVEVWLVPELGWLPARLRFTDRYGRVTESVLESMPTS